MNKKRAYALGITVGAVVGVATILFTPKYREPIGRNVRDKVNDIKEPLKEFKTSASQVKEQVNIFRERSLPAIQSTISEVRELIKTWQEDIQPHLENIKEDMQEVEVPKMKHDDESDQPPGATGTHTL